MEYETLAIYPTLVEAELMEIYLHQQGIDTRLPDRYAAMNIWHLSSLGGVRVQVPKIQFERAQWLLEELDNNSDSTFDVY